MALTREEARERGLIGSGNTFNEPGADGPGDTASNPSTGQSSESEVAMDIYGSQSTTIAEVVKREETDEDPEPGAPSIETKVVPPPLPKDIKIVDPEDRPTATPLPPVNPPKPKPEFLTEEVRTFKPIYSSFSAQIVEVINKNTVKLDTDFNQKAQENGVVEGDYQGSDPRARLTYNVTYPNFKIDDLKTELHFDEDKKTLVTNMQLDDSTVKEYPHSFVMKLDEPLDEAVVKGDELLVADEIIPPITEDVILVPPAEEEDYTVLRSPDVDSLESPVRSRATNFVTQDTLKTTDPTIKKDFEDTLVSASLASVDLNIDYSVYPNFVNFSSAEQRLINFKTKVTNIDAYTAESSSFAATSASTTDVRKWDRKIREVKQGFTGYEKYLWEDSTSFISGSVLADTVRYNSAWPKSGGAGSYADPYVNYPVTASQATTWYAGQLASASAYDASNRNSVKNLLPQFVREDSGNDDFIKFTGMIGEFYDNIWTYISHMDKIHDRSEGIVDRNQGFADELVFDVAKGLGLNVKSNKDLISLERWHLGQYLSGSTYVQYSSKPEKDIQAEIQKRLVNNLPFFLKTKGTPRALQSLINCYGIPSTILRVREFGGPDVKGKTGQFLIQRKHDKALAFSGSQYIKTKWPKFTTRPNTVELRFAGANSGSGINNRVLLEGQDSGSDKFRWGILLRDNGSTDARGNIDFVLSGSNGFLSSSINDFPIYDTDFNSVMLTRKSSSGAELTTDRSNQSINYTLFAKRYDAGRSKIFLQQSASLTITGSTYNTSFHSGSNKLYIGGLANSSGKATYNKFTGSMMEFRLWKTALSESKFDNHVAAPNAYNGNHASASYTDLVTRFSFNDNKNLSSDPNISDVSGDISYTETGSAVGFSGNFFVNIEEEHKLLVPNLGPNRMMSSKIRIEDSKLLGNLNPKKKMEESTFDLAPVDSNRVGVYFAPSDVINEDIIRSVADLNFDKYIGDPRDQYKYRYRGLKKVAESYWQKYTSPNNFWDYMRLIKYYDNSIFDLARKFMPARANTSFGIVIEPNIFERSKAVLHTSMSFDNLSFRGEIDLSQYAVENLFSASAEYHTYRGVIGYDTNHSQSFDSDIFQKPSLYKLESVDNLGNYGGTYHTASVTRGGPNYIFSEGVQPFISESRLSEHNDDLLKFYTSSLSVSIANGFGATHKLDGFYQYSSSFTGSRHDAKYDQYSNLANLFYEGCLQTIDTTPDGFSPVETTDTKQTRLVVQEPGKSRLKTER